MSKEGTALKVVERDSITLDAVDDAGVARKVNLRATIIEPSADAVRIRKQQEDPFSSSPSPEGEDEDVAASRTDDEDKYERLLGQRIIRPPVNLTKMITMKDESTELGQAIAAMVTNTVSFGWQLKERDLPDEVSNRKAKDIAAERFSLKTKLETVHPMDSLTMLREKVQEDKHACGNGYMEQIENARGDLVALDHVQGHTVRLTVKDRRPTKVGVTRVRPDRDYMVEDVPMWHRFRRFAQVREDGTVVWFKEAGDPRQLDWKTGKFAKKGEVVPFRCRATSLIHFKIYHPTSPYGMPVWFGNTLSIKGSRSAEEINFHTLNNNNIPSMMVVVENGRLTDGSIQRLKEWTEKHVANTQNYSTFLILEGEALEEGAPNPANFRIRIEPLKSQQQKDELFQDYQENNANRVRQAFRLPPIFVGRSDDYTRATADTSRDIADEQVFSAERARDDHLINRFVLLRWGSRFHQFKSNHPNITDDIELIRLMGIAEKSGAMTPRRADRIIRDVFGDNVGPMPVGIDLDKPFSVTFAEAQQGMTEGSPQPQAGGEEVAQRVINNLLDMRSKIEKELDARFLLETEEN